MQAVRRAGVLVVGVVASTAVFAQTPAPVAVPLVGSPAAQGAQVPAQPPYFPPKPPQVTATPASAPAAPAVVPSAPPPAPVAAPTAAARGERKLELSFNDGTIALDAQNVTLREIVSEWQRRGGCQFVHAEQLPATPITLQLPAGTREIDAIDSLFRSLATPGAGYGYIVGPSATTGTNRSACGAVYILASSRPTATGPYMAGAPAASPIAAPLMTPGSPDDEIPPVTPFPPVQRAQQPGVQVPVPGGTNPNPAPPSNPTPAQPSFAPIAPSAPGAGRIGGSPVTPTPPQPNGNPPNPNGRGPYLP